MEQWYLRMWLVQLNVNLTRFYVGAVWQYVIVTLLVLLVTATSLLRELFRFSLDCFLLTADWARSDLRSPEKTAYCWIWITHRPHFVFHFQTCLSEFTRKGLKTYMISADVVMLNIFCGLSSTAQDSVSKFKVILNLYNLFPNVVCFRYVCPY